MNYKTLIIAELGINHNGDRELAKKSIQAAVNAGANAVKFQNYRTEDFISDRTLEITYLSQGKSITEPQYDLFKRCELTHEDLVDIKQYCDRHGAGFLSTPTSINGVKALIDLGVSMLKNGSDYLTNTTLIRYMGETGLPTMLSTGMATFEEIEEAVQVFRETGNEQLILMHCTSVYPTPVNEVNLARMQSLANAFDCKVGFSDHSQGIVAASGAVAMGACIIEKHFTLEKNLPGPDHHFSMDPDQLSQLVTAIREMEQYRGASEITPSASEVNSREEFRLSCVAAEALSAGIKLGKEDIAFRRPGTGMRPALSDQLAGKVLKHAVPRGHIFCENDFHE